MIAPEYVMCAMWEVCGTVSCDVSVNYAVCESVRIILSLTISNHKLPILRSGPLLTPRYTGEERCDGVFVCCVTMQRHPQRFLPPQCEVCDV